MTYPQTDAIYNGLSSQGMKVNDIIAINNLKRAWYFILDTIDYIVDYNFICKVNQIIGSDGLYHSAGFIRRLSVRMGGTTWIPDMPDEFSIKDSIKSIMSIDEPTVRAITLMLYCMRSQMFIDGNKRTSMLVANQIMISSGAGIISVPIEQQDNFRKLLIRFYETNDMTIIKTFIYDYCIDGMNFNDELSESTVDVCPKCGSILLNASNGKVCFDCGWKDEN